MSRNLLIVGLIVLVAGGVATYVAMTRTPSSSPVVTASPVPRTSPLPPTDVSGGAAGTVEEGTRYIPFSPEISAGTSTTRRVLFFYANWCPICKPADESFLKNNAQIPADVTVIRVNYNDSETDQAEKDLAKQYGVTYQHTFVQIDEQGKEVTKWNGGGIEELLNNLK